MIDRETDVAYIPFWCHFTYRDKNNHVTSYEVLLLSEPVLESGATRMRSCGPEDSSISYLEMCFTSDGTFLALRLIYHYHKKQQYFNSPDRTLYSLVEFSYFFKFLALLVQFLISLFATSSDIKTNLRSSGCPSRL
jgi:hypothetical protein